MGQLERPLAHLKTVADDVTIYKIYSPKQGYCYQIQVPQLRHSSRNIRQLQGGHARDCRPHGRRLRSAFHGADYKASIALNAATDAFADAVTNAIADAINNAVIDGPRH